MDLHNFAVGVSVGLCYAFQLHNWEKFISNQQLIHMIACNVNYRQGSLVKSNYGLLSSNSYVALFLMNSNSMYFTVLCTFRTERRSRHWRDRNVQSVHQVACQQNVCIHNMCSVECLGDRWRKQLHWMENQDDVLKWTKIPLQKYKKINCATWKAAEWVKNIAITPFIIEQR
jgi:hypothetical protein